MNENGIIGRLIPLGSYGFYLEIFFAMLVFLQYAKKRKLFYLRLALACAVGFPLYWLPVMILGTFNYGYLITLVILSFVFLFAYKESFWVLLINSIAAWGLQHVGWNLAAIIYDVIPDVASLQDGILLLILYSSFALCYVLAAFAVRKLKLKIELNRTQLPSLALGGVVIVITSFLSQLVGKFDTQWNILFRIYTALCALLALIVLIGYPYLDNATKRRKALEEENKNLENMLVLQARQQELSKETIDIVNMKYHDLKNQLMVLKSGAISNQNEILENVEKEVDIYGDIARTGNEALDIVITQKALLCTSKNIRFSYIIDGKAFSFMKSTDVTSLFGNILDNAIEACEKEEENYRIIKVVAKTTNGFLTIHEENYCHQDIRFKDGLPETSKKNKDFHGFGSRAIRYVSDKYHGDFHLDLKENIFSLTILIPISEEKQAD